MLCTNFKPGRFPCPLLHLALFLTETENSSSAACLVPQSEVINYQRIGKMIHN